jgi:predicted metalloprotease with PDZ domain
VQQRFEAFVMQALVSYRVGSQNPLTHLYDVEMTIHQPQVTQVVSLPVWIPGSYMVREFSRHLQGLSAVQGRRTCTLTQLNKNTWSVSCQSRKALTLRYQVYAFDPSVRAAYLDDQRAFFNGTSLFLRAHGFSDQAHELTLQAPKGTRGWKVATALRPKSVDPKGWGHYLAETYDELIDAPFECGTFWSGEFVAAQVKHRVVVTGATAAFDGKRLLADVQRICTAAIEMWHGKKAQAPHRHYVFLLHAVEDGYGGLEHRHSTALICSRRDLPRQGQSGLSDNYVTLLGLISHEYFHTWNVKRLRPSEFAQLDLEQENHTSLLWFFEGFTSYFDDWLLVKAGLIDAPHYLRLLGKTIASVQHTPGRKVQSVAQSSFDAWVKYYRQDENTPNATVSYYTKGSLVALCLDLSLRLEGSSLPAVMRGLWKRCAGGPMSEGDLLAELKKLTHRDWTPELQHWVHSTRDLPLAALLRAHGVKIDTESDSISQRLGLKVQETAAGIVIKGVARDSAAEQAGMSAGDEWLGIQVTASPASQAWRLKKLDDLPLLLGSARRCKALICRDQTLHWLTLKWPPLSATHWTLQPDPAGAEALGRWL